MDYKERYSSWLNNGQLDQETVNELRSISGNEEEIQDRFYRDLEFGTAGLRGKIGAGTNRMNKYIIMRTTQALAEVVKADKSAPEGVVIAYDCRHFSDLFAETAAGVLAANGVKTWLFEGLRPTPELSWAVRRLKAKAGIVITASHNPKEYNGYKVYWSEGSQILSETANQILDRIDKIEDVTSIEIMNSEEAKDKGLLEILGEEMDSSYIDAVKALSLRDEELDKDINITYTPLNGTGNIPVRRVLRERGFNNIHVVKDQEMPDPDFKTVGYPNPEDPKAFALAEEAAANSGSDLIIATDPDCDRLAVEVRDKDGNYKFINGNQTGAILVEYILSTLSEKSMMPRNPVIVKTIVTGELSREIASKYGVTTIDTLTGFKNICSFPNKWDETGECSFVFGYEESIGYVYGDIVRDKDAVNAAMFLAEAAAYYKKKGKSLLDVLDDLYAEYGFYSENLISFKLEGKAGQERIGRMMKDLRVNYPEESGDSKLVRVIDYKTLISKDLNSGEESSVDIQATNALKFHFDDSSWYAVRPSGTEPKIKIYIYTVSTVSMDDAVKKLAEIEKTITDKLNSVE